MKSIMTPFDRYRLDLAEGILMPDSAQASTVVHFQRIHDELMKSSNGRVGGPAAALSWLHSRLSRDRNPKNRQVRGLYLHGGVGRGKTYLMDVFFESLPFEDKMRTHFHRFMQRVHAELALLKQQKNPLESVARRIAAEARVLCFDEFFVSDIADAMILGGLLTHLMEEGVTLVATSNIEPDRLYENGLQRERFLPAISLLKQFTEVVELEGGVDYRLRSLQQAQIYYSPLGDEADAELLRSFRSLAPDHAVVEEGAAVEVLGRQIMSIMSAGDVIWFNFADLCGGPRSAYDYIELARLYHAILLSDVPQLGADKDDMARRFVSLVDELYDRNVKLIISADVPLLQLYAGSSLVFVFERTTSRLLEMQSHEYLGREHRP